MKFRLKFPSILFYGISGSVVVISIISFFNALSWINAPFAGFLVYDEPYVGTYSSRDWPGPQAGLRTFDRVVSINGEPVLEGRDVVKAFRQKKPGTQVHLVVESKGTIREVTLPVSTFSVRDFFLIYVTTFLGGLVLYGLGFIVYMLKPNKSSTWVFLLCCLTVGIYMITGFDILTSYNLVYLHYGFLSLFPVLFIHLTLIFPERKRILDRYPALEYLIYLPGFILCIAYQTYFITFPENVNPAFSGWVPNYKTLSHIARVFSLVGVLIVVGSLIHALVTASSPQARQRAKMILLGFCVAFGTSVLGQALAFFSKIYISWNLFVFVIIFFPAAIAYSIAKHNLFDADAIIRRTVGYVVVTAIVVGAYVLVSIVFNVFLGQYQVSQSKVFPIVFTLIIILIFNPLRNRIQSLVDRIFFRKEYDYGEIIDKISNAITSLLDLGQILKQMVRTFMEDMFINTSSVMLLNPAKTEYQVYLADGERRNEIEKVIFKKDEPLIQIIEKEKKELTKYDVLEDPKYRTVCEGCTRNFETVSASLMVPLVFQGEVIGLLNLGEKKSGKFYNREDIDLLRTLANQGAVAIENARLVDQMKSEEAVRANLARYLSPQIVDQVIKKNVQVNLGGDRKVVTVLFSDIRNFTRISESLPPDKLVQLLNEYFTEMAKIIFENQGSLDKYIGDAIVAVFGSLIPLENPGRTAVQAAVQMMKEMTSLNDRWKNQYGFTMDIGIGINTGEVFLGNIGSPERMEFTVIGDTVNIASRFSDVAKPGQILITKETLASLGQDIRHKELPPTEVKGKTGNLEVFEIVY